MNRILILAFSVLSLQAHAQRRTVITTSNPIYSRLAAPVAWQMDYEWQRCTNLLGFMAPWQQRNREEAQRLRTEISGKRILGQPDAGKKARLAAVASWLAAQDAWVLRLHTQMDIIQARYERRDANARALSHQCLSAFSPSASRENRCW